MSFQLEHNLHLQFHASPLLSHNNRKVHTAGDPSQHVLVTIGEDSMLHLWDLQTNSHLLFQQLQGTPTAIKAIGQYSQFLLGYANGTLQILQLVSQGNKHRLDLVKEETQDGNNYILNIQVSNLQQKFAVSFDSTGLKSNPSTSHQQAGLPFIRVWERIEESFVKNENTIYLKVNESTSDTQEMRQGVYFMFFSSDDQFLIFCQ